MNKKGLIFIGCSFTYGYGLQHYYEKEHNQPFDTDFPSYYGNMLFPKEEFRKLNRFSNLVSSQINTWNATREGLSGDDYESIEFLHQAFKIHKSDPNHCRWNLNTDEISDVIIQTTYPIRSYKHLIGMGEELLLDNSNDDDGVNHEENGILNELINTISKKYNDIGKWLELNGIKVHFIHITNDYIKDTYIKDRTIKISDMGFISIDDYMDYDNGRIVDELDIKDFHPSLNTHKVIAESILRKL